MKKREDILSNKKLLYGGKERGWENYHLVSIFGILSQDRLDCEKSFWNGEYRLENIKIKAQKPNIVIKGGL